MSKKCPKCGSILFDTVNFCPNCGFQLISKSQENQKTHRNSLESTKISDFLNNLNFLKTSHIYFHIKNFFDFGYEHDSQNKEKNNIDKEKSSNNLSFLESPRNKILLILILLPVIFYGGFLTLVILLLICVLYYFYMKNHTNSEYIQDSQNKENNYNYTKNYNTYEYKNNTTNLKEKEIQRLIDSLGKEEPVQGILTDDEILKYAGNSKTASKIRLKRGIGNQSDKSKVNNINTRYIILYVPIFLIVLTLFVCGFTITLNSYGAIFFIFIFFMMIGYLCIGGGYIVYCVYTMYIKDYTEPQFKQNTQKENKKIEHTTNDDLLLLFKSKEKIAREMIEKRFSCRGSN